MQYKITNTTTEDITIPCNRLILPSGFVEIGYSEYNFCSLDEEFLTQCQAESLEVSFNDLPVIVPNPIGDICRPCSCGLLGFYIQDEQPVLANKKMFAFWENTLEEKLFLIYKDSTGIEKLVELT